MPKKRSKKLVAIVLTLSIFALFLAVKNKDKAGSCDGNGLCWVHDLANDETIAVNDHVTRDCKFVDKANVSCPIVSLKEKNEWRRFWVTQGTMKCEDAVNLSVCKCKDSFFWIEYWKDC